MPNEFFGDRQQQTNTITLIISCVMLYQDIRGQILDGKGENSAKLDEVGQQTGRDKPVKDDPRKDFLELGGIRTSWQ